MNYNFYDITPRIFRAGQKCAFTIRARYEQRFFADGDFLLRYVPCDGVFPEDGRPAQWDQFRQIDTAALADNQTMEVEFTFSAEGEYTFRLYRRDEDGDERLVMQFAMYALEADLFALRPYKGDIHNHSSYSECGCRDDNPRYVAAIARYCGLDFLSISDHMQRLPSVIAMEFVDSFKTDYRLFPAQEMHMLGERVSTLFCRNRFLCYNHLVAWGVEADLARDMNDNFEEYMLEVTGRAAAIHDPSMSEDMKFICAGADWICDRIHEYGGMVVFCHPFWKPNGRYNLPAPVREYILANRKWDVIEVLQSADHDDPCHNAGICQSISWWQEASIKAGRMLPLVGVTDTHDVEAGERGTRYTLVFAPNSSYAALREAMTCGNALGAEQNGQSCIFVGKPRLVNYAYFLAREYFREHDDICRTEGSLMREYLNGGCDAKTVSDYAEGRIERLFRKYWQP